MKIGDSVLIRGTIDEIRRDTVIIKNEGGYFGTAPEEIIDKCDELCEDAISRAEVKKIVDFYKEQFDGVYRINESIDRLPSVTQEPKKGEWIEKDGFDGDVYYDCSECGESWATIEGTPWDNEWHFCPNCGVKMG